MQLHTVIKLAVKIDRKTDRNARNACSFLFRRHSHSGGIVVSELHSHHTCSSMSDDWADDTSPSQRNELDRDWDLRREQHYNVSCLRYTSQNVLGELEVPCTNLQNGYREGLDQGKEQTLQQGFDSGMAWNDSPAQRHCCTPLHAFSS